MFAERREMRSLQKAGLLPKSLFSGHSDRPLSTGPTSLTFPDITGVCREQETISPSLKSQFWPSFLMGEGGEGKL